MPDAGHTPNRISVSNGERASWSSLTALTQHTSCSRLTDSTTTPAGSQNSA